LDNIGALCYEKCRDGYEKRGGTSICYNKKPMTKPILADDVKSRGQCNSNREFVGALCYLKCSQGYHRDGVICVADKMSFKREEEDQPCDADYDKTAIGCTLHTYQRTAIGACRSNREYINGLCYLKCRPDLDASGNDLGTGYTRQQMIQCLPPKGQNYSREKKQCNYGYDAREGFCWRHSYNRGAGEIPYECNSNRELVTGMCYAKCENTDKETPMSGAISNGVKYHRSSLFPTQCIPPKGELYSKYILAYAPDQYVRPRANDYSEKEQYVAEPSE